MQAILQAPVLQCVSKSQEGTVQLFWKQIKFDGLTIDFKSNKLLLWSKCLELDKTKRPFPLSIFKKPTWQDQLRLHLIYLQTPGNFRQLLAKTAGNRYLRRFLPASSGFFYLRISLPTAFAGNFARASFTVASSNKLINFRVIKLFLLGAKMNAVEIPVVLHGLHKRSHYLPSTTTKISVRYKTAIFILAINILSIVVGVAAWVLFSTVPITSSISLAML